MHKNSKIYIAGHRGLVGSAILRKLAEQGFNNLVYKEHRKLDLRRQLDTEKFFKIMKPEYVFLAAAKAGGILANSTYKAEFIYDNITIATNVINSAYKYGVKKLLNLGSSCIYPKFCPQPMKSEYLLTGSLEPTNEPYAVAKIAAIKLCRYYNEQYGTDFISAMPTNLYGINDNFNLETSHAIAALIRKFNFAKGLREEKFDLIKKDIKRYPLGYGLDSKINLESKESIIKVLGEIGINKDYVTLWGTGEVYREFLYVDDLALAGIFLMENFSHKDIGEFINVGAGKDLKVKEIAEKIKEIIGFEGEISWDSSKPDGMPQKLLDSSRINKLGWSPKVDLEEGIKREYEWFKEQIL